MCSRVAHVTLGHAVSHGGVERCSLRRILHTSTSGMCSMRLPLGDLVVVFLLSVLAAVSPRTATASKPFTTELMVQNQDVGEFRFSTDGKIGRAQVRTHVTNDNLVCRPTPENKNR